MLTAESSSASKSAVRIHARSQIPALETRSVPSTPLSTERRSRPALVQPAMSLATMGIANGVRFGCYKDILEPGGVCRAAVLYLKHNKLQERR